MACSPVPKVGGAAAPSAPPVPTPMGKGSCNSHRQTTDTANFRQRREREFILQNHNAVNEIMLKIRRLLNFPTSPNFACLDEHVIPRRRLSCSKKFYCGHAPPSPRATTPLLQ